MTSLVSQLPPFFAAILVLLVVVGLALVGQWVVGSALSLQTRQAHNHLFGLAGEIVGVINAVLLAFIVFAVWTNYDRAKDVVSLESTMVLDIARDAEAALPVHDSVLDGMQNYVSRVLEFEWPHMRKGGLRDSSGDSGFGPGWTELNRTYHLILRSDTSAASHSVVAEELTRRFNLLLDARRQRIAFSTDGSLNGTIWGVVLTGALLTLACCWLLGVESRRLHAVGTALVAASLALVFFLIISLERPFQGRNQIAGDSFCVALSIIHRQEGEENKLVPIPRPSSCPPR